MSIFDVDCVWVAAFLLLLFAGVVTDHDVGAAAGAAVPAAADVGAAGGAAVVLRRHVSDDQTLSDFREDEEEDESAENQTRDQDSKLPGQRDENQSCDLREAKNIH